VDADRVGRPPEHSSFVCPSTVSLLVAEREPSGRDGVHEVSFRDSHRRAHFMEGRKPTHFGQSKSLRVGA